MWTTKPVYIVLGTFNVTHVHVCARTHTHTHTHTHHNCWNSVVRKLVVTKRKYATNEKLHNLYASCNTVRLIK